MPLPRKSLIWLAYWVFPLAGLDAETAIDGMHRLRLIIRERAEGAGMSWHLTGRYAGVRVQLAVTPASLRAAPVFASFWGLKQRIPLYPFAPSPQASGLFLCCALGATRCQ
jgi:hypothetical protein